MILKIQKLYENTNIYTLIFSVHLEWFEFCYVMLCNWNCQCTVQYTSANLLRKNKEKSMVKGEETMWVYRKWEVNVITILVLCEGTNFYKL